ncbi:MAG: elongation factor P [Kiritimatiellia bacterium]|jgi:elongation factor P
MYSASDLKKGLKIEIDGEPHIIVDFTFSKPGKGQAMYKCRLKNVKSGSQFEKTYRSVDKINKPDLRDKDMSYSYPDGDNFVFMDPTTYDQFTVDAAVIGDMKFFLEEDMTCKVLFHNDTPLEVTLPNFVEKAIAETEPGAKGDTATNVTKPASIENGYEIRVPLFINIGDTVRIDTRTGEYADRVSKG